MTPFSAVTNVVGSNLRLKRDVLLTRASQPLSRLRLGLEILVRCHIRQVKIVRADRRDA